MRSVRYIVLAATVTGLAACNDDPLRSDAPGEPTPPVTGVQAYLQVDNEGAEPGDVVRIAVKVQFGTDSEAKLGSYTGRLRFDPELLVYRDEVNLNDGLRVSNPNDADTGEIRFAGAAARGFEDLTLYAAMFRVRRTPFVDGLGFEMEEMSEALTLRNLKPDLDQAEQVFFQRAAR
ncbi:MAG: hypothetical protein ACE5PT_14430 [Gemmatimonadales bacterium]